MKKTSQSGGLWLALGLVIVSLLLGSHVHSSSTVRGSSRLGVSLAGNKLSWTLNHIRNSSNNTVQLSIISVYSTPGLSHEIASVRVKRHMFNLGSLSLTEGTYYIQVAASFGNGKRRIASEVVVYNVTNEGKTSSKTSFTILIATVSTVLGTAVLVGSVLFALTMWKIRSRGRRSTARHSNNALNNKETNVHRKRCGIARSACGCCCRKWFKKRVGHLTHPIGPQLRTIQARDKNGGLFPLHVVNRDASSTHSDLDRSNASKPVPIAKSIKAEPEDLPYGYVSPADINIPHLRKFTKSEKQPPTLATNQQEGYVNVDFTDSAVQCKNYDGPISLSESIYSIPCTLTASMEEEYDNTQTYLSVIQS